MPFSISLPIPGTLKPIQGSINKKVIKSVMIMGIKSKIPKKYKIPNMILINDERIMMIDYAESLLEYNYYVGFHSFILVTNLSIRTD